MTQPPVSPKIYHIVNVDRLPSIVAEGHLYGDTQIAKRQLPGTTIGMSTIKERRLKLPVSCYLNATVGDFVPFYFCPRSVMLYVIHRANNPELAYKGGQGPIVHLEADLNAVIAWAGTAVSWAFSDGNASAAYTKFWRDQQQMDQLNWDHIANNNWAASDVKEAKQAEFLMYHSFPWHLVDRIGVRSLDILNAVSAALIQSGHKPAIEITPQWYY